MNPEGFAGLEAKISRWRLAVRSAAGRLAFQEFPSLSVAALEMAARRFHAASLPRIFSTELRQIPPTLNEDLLDLYGSSEQILANQFSFFHTTRRFGAEIDWRSRGDSPWSRELHSFDFALDLALTYRISREERYARHLRYLIADWIAANPPSWDAGWRKVPLARRVRNWILASDLARDDWEAHPEFLRMVLDSLALQCVFLTELQGAQSDEGPSNLAFTTKLWGERALAFLQKLFPDIDRADHSGGFQDSFWESLVEEPELGGHVLRPRNLLNLAEAVLDVVLLESDREGPGVGKAKNALRRVLVGLEALLLPDGTLPLFGEEAAVAAEAIQNLYATAAVALGDSRWKSIAGQWGILPHMFLGEKGWESFRELGVVPWMSSSFAQPQSSISRLPGSQSSALVANLRPPSSAADHEDYLSYELMIRGQRVVVDSGAYRPPGDSEGLHFTRPEAHNVLIIEKKHAMWRVADPRAPISFRRCSGNGWSGFLASGLSPDHERLWALAEPNIWVVLDRLDGPPATKRRITSLLHFFPTFELEEETDSVIARSRALTVTVIPLSPVPCVMRFTKGNDARCPAWYSPEFGTRFASSALALEWRGAPSPCICGYALVDGEHSGIRFGKTDARSGSAELWAAERTFNILFGDSSGARAQEPKN